MMMPMPGGQQGGMGGGEKPCPMCGGKGSVPPEMAQPVPASALVDALRQPRDGGDAGPMPEMEGE